MRTTQPWGCSDRSTPAIWRLLILAVIGVMVVGTLSLGGSAIAPGYGSATSADPGSDTEPDAEVPTATPSASDAAGDPGDQTLPEPDTDDPLTWDAPETLPSAPALPEEAETEELESARPDVNSAITPLATGNVPPFCLPGHVYTIRSEVTGINWGNNPASGTTRGQLGQIINQGSTSSPTYLSSEMTVATVNLNGQSQPFAANKSYNGLGIGANGDLVFAYERSSTSAGVYTAQIKQYSPTTGQWTSVGTPQNLGRVGAIGGAVSPTTGEYFFGGYLREVTGGSWQWVWTGWYPELVWVDTYSSTGHLWAYDPSTGQVRKVGYISVPDTDQGQNGDFAFDAAGNLIMVRGVGNQVEIFTITTANLAAANNNQIPRSATNSITTTFTNVNGVAFDSDGTAYLGNGTTIGRFDPTTWQQLTPNPVTNSMNNSTDLASCTTPSTLTIQKEVGGRIVGSDQFTLTVRQQGQSQDFATATTAGSATGIQAQQIGPTPVRTGTTYNFAETMASGSGSALNQYASSYRCVDQANTVRGSGTLTGPNSRGASIQIPTALVNGESPRITCIITNSPLGSISVTKADESSPNTVLAGAQFRLWRDVNGNGTLETAVDQQVGSIQTTPANGVVSWNNIAWGAYLLEEVAAPTGYQLGTPTVRPLTLNNGTTSIRVENPRTPGTINWEKISDDSPAELLGGSEWTLQGPGANGPTVTVTDCVAASASECTGLDKNPAAGQFQVTDLAWGSYTLVESQAPPGFTADPTPRTVTISATNAAVGVSFDPLTNTRILGEASWRKVGETGNTLAGSTWRLTGPDGLDVIVDDFEGTPPNNDGYDQDGNAGAFQLTDLAWGDYVLVETRAPAGYQLDPTPHSFTIGPDEPSFQIDLGDIENTQQDPLTIPLTGGLGSDQFWITGGLILALALALIIWRRRRAGAMAE